MPRSSRLGTAAILLTSASVLGIPALGSARTARLSIAGGVFHRPDDARTGSFVGIGATLYASERLRFGVTADWVRTTETLEQLVSVDDRTERLVQDDQERHYLPVFATINWKLGDAEERGMAPYLIGGAGFLTLRSYHENSVGNASRNFFGYGAELGAGLDFGGFFLEGSWQLGTTERSGDEPRRGAPLDERVKPSGVGVRLGIRL